MQRAFSGSFTALLCLIGSSAWLGVASSQELATPANPTPAPVNQPEPVPGLAMEGAPQVPSGSAVGRTRGSFSVSSTGAAQYVIPLWMPPGIAGLKPSLALTYSSAAGDGPYGVGWNLAGLSNIARCPKTVAQDGLAAQVFLTSADLFCLDGNKLRSFSGTYGADGSQYQTEIADFSLVISHGTAGTGPAWFEVHGKNGLIYQYGNTTDSALLATGTASVIQWALNKVTDRFGNHIDIVYTNDTSNQVLRPNTISYTTPPSGAPGVQAQPNYQVQFTFQSRTSPVPSGFVTGAQFMEPYLAQIVTIAAYNGSGYSAERTYNLTYTTGAATGRSLLNTIQECSPTQCFSPTTVGYQSGQTGWGSGVSIGGQSHSLGSGMVGDLNGDGIDDIVYQDSTNGLSYFLGSSSGTYSGPYTANLPGSTGAVIPIDFNGDGRMELIGVNSSGNLRVFFYQSPGGAFTYTDTAIPAPANFGTGYVITGDVDGDGRADLIYAVSSGSSWWTPDYIYYRLNTGGGFGAQQLLAQIGPGSGSCKRGAELCQKLLNVPFGAYTQYNSRVRRADFNGDGRIDFFVNIESCVLNDQNICQSPFYTWNLAVSDATTDTYDFLDVVDYGATGLSTLVPPLIGDFNGDGCSDVVYLQGNTWYVQYGTCLRSGASNALSAPVNTGVSAPSIYPMAIDWDGDGRDDIVTPDSTSGHIGYLHSTGTGFGPWTSTGIPYNNADNPNYVALVVDVHGDGQYGIVYPTGSGYALTAFPHNGAGTPADLATSFTDGFGFNFRPSYAQLTQSNVYTKGTGAVYPEQDIRTAMTVVSSYSASDGIGGTYTVTETYSQARTNLPRQQFEGFGTITSVDSRNSVVAKNYFAQLSPETGMTSRLSVLQPNGSTFISDVQNTVTYATLDATNKRYFPYVSQAVANAYEYGGGLNGTLVTQKTTTWSYAGSNGFTYGNPSQISTTTVDKDPNSPWTGNSFVDTVNITPYEVGGSGSTGWCIHLPSQISEQRTQVPANTSLTHTQSFGVNQNSQCELDSQTVEPSSSTDKVVTTFAYTDGCGNVNTVTVTGQNPGGTAMSARSTSYGYGSHCIAPETVTNALTQSSTLGYNYNLGLLASAKDPNLLQTSWSYNDIGQKTLEQRPDGTQTSYAITACTSHCGSSTPLEYYLVTQEQDSTSGHATFRQHDDYFDQLDRLIKDQVQISTGQYADTLVAYDSLGRLAQKSSPYMDGATQYFTAYQYDLVNRATQMSRPISATNQTLEYTYYTYQGRTQTVKDPRLNITTNQSDVIGELGIVTDPDGVSKTTYSYDAFSHLTQIKDPGTNLTTRSYDTLGYLLTGSSDPDRGSWTYQSDSLGELLNLRDAKTQSPNWTQQLTYDALGRTLQRVEPEGTSTWTWGTVAAHHEIGRLTGLSGLNDSETYTFDGSGRPATRAMTWGGKTYTVSFSYNTLGKLNQLTYPLAQGQTNPFTVQYGYNYGYTASAQNYTGGVAGTTFWELTPSTTNMDSWGHTIDETLGTTTAVRIQSAYDAVTSWATTRTVGSGGSLNNIQNLAYQWDLNGSLSQREDIIQSLTEVFNYDNLNRLQTSTLNSTQNLSVAIDATGNITSRTEGGITYPYSYDATHTHAVHTVGNSPNQTTYTYDANGNMATRNGNGVTWASYNLPTSITGPNNTSASFYYGPDRQRKEQDANYVVDGENGLEQTIYVFGLYEFESTPAQSHNKYFIAVPGGTQIIYDIQSVSGAQTTYITADHLGSGNVFLSSSGAVSIKGSYSAYGYRRSSNWSGPLSSTSSDYTTIASTTRRGYTDAFHEMLDNLNLIHMNGRVYDPVIGRFLSPDPVVTQVGDSQRGNPYSYVENRPLTVTDPTGLSPCGSLCKMVNGDSVPYPRNHGQAGPGWGTSSPAAQGVGGYDLGAVGAGAGSGSYGEQPETIYWTTNSDGTPITYQGTGDASGVSTDTSTDSGNSSFQDGINVRLVTQLTGQAIDSMLSQISAENGPSMSDPSSLLYAINSGPANADPSLGGVFPAFLDKTPQEMEFGTKLGLGIGVGIAPMLGGDPWGTHSDPATAGSKSVLSFVGAIGNGTSGYAIGAQIAAYGTGGSVVIPALGFGAAALAGIEIGRGFNQAWTYFSGGQSSFGTWIYNVTH